jgi:hypothetical protein
MSIDKKNTDETNAKNAVTDSPDTEVLVEKVREIERAKQEAAKAIDAKNLEKENTAKILAEKQHFTPVMTDDEAKKNMSGRTRRSFLIGGAAAVFGYLGYGYLREQGEAPFRRAFEFNEKVSQLYYSPARLAPEFDRSRVGNLRVNGGEGLSEGFNTETWRLQVVGVANAEKFPQYANDIAYETAMDNSSEMRETSRQHENPDAKQKPAPGEMPPAEMDRAAAMQMKMPGLLLTLNDIKNLPRVEMTTELKCIEGWSTIVNWAGARFSDFIARFLPATHNGSQPDINRPQDFLPYVSLVTPDGGYYVGMDMPSILHPQTLLVYEMNGEPLSIQHGAPLRLVTPTKYGIKQIKRIGRISFTSERPADFWAERGYDWYSGH